MGKKKKKNVSLLVLPALLVALGAGSITTYKIIKSYRSSSNSYKEIQNDKLVDLTINEPVTTETLKEQYDRYKLSNSDYVGWITIPNTRIDYPIVKGSDNNYYLTHDFNGSVSDNGAIFIDNNVTYPFLDRNTIIHGHHMKDGSMFQNLSKYKSKDFYNSHKIIKISTSDKILEYEVISAFNEVVNKDSYITKFNSTSSFLTYANSMINKSLYHTDCNGVESADRLLVLSTCSYETDDSRFLVVAKLKK